MNKSQLIQNLQLRGIRIGGDDPVFVLLEQNEILLKKYVTDMQKEYVASVRTKTRNEERISEYIALIFVLGGASIIFSFVVGLWIGTTHEMFRFGAFLLGCAVGIGFGIGGTVFGKNLIKIVE